jgi:hypothetical protein
MPVENAIPVVPSAPVTGSAALSTDLGDEWLPEVTTPNSSQPDVRTTPPPLQTVSQLPEQMRTGVQVQAPTKPPKDALLELAWRDYSARLVGELQVRRQAGVSTTWEANAAKSGREGRPAELAQPTGAAREAVAQRIAFEPRTDAAWMRKEGPALPTVHPTPTATTETTRLVDPAAVPVLNESASPAQRPIANPAATAEPAHLDAKTQTNPTEPTSPRTAVRVEEVQALMDQVSRQIVRRVGEGGGSVRLRLEPPELGRLRLEVQVNQDVVRAQAVVESAKARAMLVEHLPLLKQVLAGQGMHLERFDVAEHSLQHQEANSQFTQDHSNARDDRPGASTPAGDQPSDPAGRQAPVYRLRGLAGNIHVTV